MTPKLPEKPTFLHQFKKPNVPVLLHAPAEAIPGGGAGRGRHHPRHCLSSAPHGPRSAPHTRPAGRPSPPRRPRLSTGRPFLRQAASDPPHRPPGPSPPADGYAEGYTAGGRLRAAQTWGRPRRFAPRAGPPPFPLGSIQHPGPAAPVTELAVVRAGGRPATRRDAEVAPPS